MRRFLVAVVAGVVAVVVTDLVRYQINDTWAPNLRRDR